MGGDGGLVWNHLIMITAFKILINNVVQNFKLYFSKECLILDFPGILNIQILRIRCIYEINSIFSILLMNGTNFTIFLLF